MPPPVRIAFGITDTDVGGAERNLLTLATGLDRRRWRPSVVSLLPPGPLAEPLIQAGIRVDSLSMRSARDLPLALARWRRILLEERPAILQTFLFHANLLGRLAGRWAKVPRIVSGVRVAERRTRWHARLDRWTRGLVDCHVCVSQGVRDFAAGHARIPPERLCVIPNGIDVAAVERVSPIDLTPYILDETGENVSGAGEAQAGARNQHTVLTFVGRLDPQKGLDDLIEAVARLPAGIRTRLRIVMVGDGPSRSALEARIRKLGLEATFRFVGWQAQAIAWIKGGDGLVLPSHWEGMPNVVLEAMAASKPVIATAVEGSTELVRPGETGWLVAPRDPAALSRALAALVESPRLARDFGQAGYQLVREEFTIARMVARYEELFEELLDRGAMA